MTEGELDILDLEIDSDLEALVESCREPEPPPPPPSPPPSYTKRKRGLTERPRLRALHPPTPPAAVEPAQSANKETSDMWWQQYAPQSADELALHKWRLGEVRGWLESAMAHAAGSRVLVLEGPAGSGKSACVRALAHDMDIALVEWENGGDGVVRQFGEFLAQAQRYALAARRLILVEDVPNVSHLATRDAFERALRRFAAEPAHMSCPLVLILSDTGDDDSWTAGSLAAGSGFHVIRFRPVAPTIVERGLRRIIRQRLQLPEKKRLPAELTKVVKRLGAESEGDLRVAVTMLQLETARPVVAARRTGLDLFHALGRVLHAKRVGGQLEASADDVLRRVPMDLGRFRVFVHESYADFCAHIDEAAAVSEALSAADVLSPRGFDAALEWCAAAVAVRGHMRARGSAPVPEGEEGAPLPRWTQARRPAYFDALRGANANARLLRDAAPGLRLCGLRLGARAAEELALWAPVAARRGQAPAELRPLLAIAAPAAASELLDLLPANSAPEPEKLVLSDDDIEEFSDA
ncbi:RFC checkpoint protein Rad17 [Coemansia sp. RSA 2705]|nr:RFC checkpoint protein Rad17 [Coemansia sp. RSA 2705]